MLHIQSHSFPIDSSLLFTSSLHRIDFLVLLQDIRQRPHRRNTKRVNLLMTLGVVLLYMLKLRRTTKRLFVPIQLPQPLVQSWVPGPDVTDVALEMLHVYDVEADDGRVQSDVCLRDVLPIVVRSRRGRKMLLRAIE